MLRAEVLGEVSTSRADGDALFCEGTADVADENHGLSHPTPPSFEGATLPSAPDQDRDFSPDERRVCTAQARREARCGVCAQAPPCSPFSWVSRTRMLAPRG